MAATTTRKVSSPSPQRLALFTFLLPSLMITVDCGFRYVYVLGYDAGDPYYDSAAGMQEVLSWFDTHVQSVMAKKGILIEIKSVRVNNSLKKPGPVFVEMVYNIDI